MRFELVLEIAGADLPAYVALERRLAGGPPHPTVRDVAGLLARTKPHLVAAGFLRRAAGRHRWAKSTAEVPWSAVPGNLYTCRSCGAMRRSVPPDVSGNGRWSQEFALPQRDGTPAWSSTRPPCPGASSAEHRGVPL